MSRPLVAIVGRPNVGKSALFNALSRSRLAITDATAGTTRDRLLATVQREGWAFDLVDTGGMGGADSQGLDESIESQIDLALSDADLILVAVDVAAGLLPPDEEVAGRVRRSETPVILAANKADTPGHDVNASEFHALGLGVPIPVSALHRRQLDELFDEIRSRLGATAVDEDVAEDEFRIAVCGRQNSGKSTLVNAWAESPRAIVSDIPGTTRDSVNVHIRRGDLAFVAIDTAGLRRKRQGPAAVDFYSTIRTEGAVKRADVVVLLIDAVQGPAAGDRRIARLCRDLFKPTIVVVNKWDLAGEVSTGEYLKFLDSRLPRMAYAPVLFISAAERERIWDLARVAAELHAAAGTTSSTADVNRALHEALERQSPPVGKRGPAKAFYATQVGTAPPRFVIFVNSPGRFEQGYRRYLAGAMAASLDLDEVPVKLIFKPRH